VKDTAPAEKSIINMIWPKRVNISTKTNKQLCHKRLCPENKVLQLMFYYELKLYWMKVCWRFERSLLLFFHLCTKK